MNMYFWVHLSSHFLWLPISPFNPLPVAAFSQLQQEQNQVPSLPAWIFKQAKFLVCPYIQSTQDQPLYASLSYMHVHISSTCSLALPPRNLPALQVETDPSGGGCCCSKPSTSHPGSQQPVCHWATAACQLHRNAPEFPISTKQYW